MRPGQIITIKIFGGIEHDGILTERGTVISASKKIGCVSEETLLDFSGGRKIENKGYPTNLPEWQVIQNARSKIGQPWHLFNNNCQHFASYCHGVTGSRQLSALANIAILTFSVLFIRKITKA